MGGGQTLPLHMRVVGAVEELADGERGTFVTVTAISTRLQEQWRGLFPRPARAIAGWARTAVDVDLLIEKRPDDWGRRRFHWDQLEYALA